MNGGSTVGPWSSSVRAMTIIDPPQLMIEVAHTLVLAGMYPADAVLIAGCSIKCLGPLTTHSTRDDLWGNYWSIFKAS
jgi:hypothetical protein